MKNFLNKISKNHAFWVLLVAGAVLRIVHALKEIPLSWDGSVYVGMGKFIFSHGAIGTWEVFRPVGMPILLGASWKLGLDPYVFGIALVILANLGIAWLLYKLGEKIFPYAGLAGAAIWLFVPIIFSYSSAPMSDIPSAFFALGALYVVSAPKKTRSYFLAGLLSATAFLFRFSQGLIVVVCAIVIVMESWRAPTWTARVQAVFKNGFFYTLGFVLLVAPYFISIYHYYGDPLIGLKEGNAIIKHFPTFYQKGTWFYAKNIHKLSAWLYVALVPIVMMFTPWRKKFYVPAFVATLIALCVYFGYFTHEPHKEIRYAFAFVPYMAALAGLGVALLWVRFKIHYLWVFAPLFVLGIGVQIMQTKHMELMTEPYRNFYHYFSDKPGVVLASATPMVSINDVRLLYPLYDSWASAKAVYTSHESEIEYVVFDSCDLEVACSENSNCLDGKKELHDILESQGENVFSEKSGRCELEIYKTS